MGSSDGDCSCDFSKIDEKNVDQVIRDFQASVTFFLPSFIFNFCLVYPNVFIECDDFERVA